MSRAGENYCTRRRFLEGLGVSAAAIVGTGTGGSLQSGMFSRPGKGSAEGSSVETGQAEKAGIRQETKLSGRWGLQVDLYDEGNQVGYYSLDFPTEDWRQVSIPCGFDECAVGMDRFRGICWFCRHFEAPTSMRGRRVVLHFEGVNYNSSVWVNGKLVGKNEDAFLPFEVPVDDVLRYGEDNLIVVRVDNKRHPAQLPTSEYWYGQGGILRDVKLIATDQTRLTDIAITAVPEGGQGKFALRALVANGRSQSASFSLQVKILNRATQQVASFAAAPTAVEAGKEAEATLEGEVPEVRTWSPEHPTLYTARLDLLVDEKLADQQQVRFGFRRIEARKGKLWLNGKPLFLMGFNRHEDSPRTGMALDPETSRQDFLAIKGAGANFVRFCHYPHSPEELQLCDELGLLVLGEIPLCGWGVKLNDPYAGRGWEPSLTPTILDNAKRSLRKMILRDFNHPSIIIWSVSNESEESHPEVNRGNSELIRFGRRLDPSRLMTHVSCHWTSKAVDFGACSAEEGRYFESDDVISVNGYPSWRDRKGHRPGDNSWMAESTRWWRNELARLQARYPGKPILVSEFGYMSIEGVLGSAGEDTQALATRAEFEGIDAPYVGGATLWIYAKHPWPGGCFDLNISPFGYVSRDRKTKMKAFSVVSEMFRQRAKILAK